MHSVGRDRGLPWWLSGFATLVAHGAVMFALPDASPTRAPQRAHEESIWFTLLEGTPAAQSAAGEIDAERAATPFALTQSKPAARKPRAKRSEATRAPTSSAAPSTAPRDGGEFAAAGAPELSPAPDALERADDVAQGVAPAGSESSASNPFAGANTGAGHGVHAGHGQRAAHGPGLLAVPNACRGFFPAAAKVDHGEVRITVEVDTSGRARASRLLTEMPHGQGFGRAAQACAAALRFTPAVDMDGSAIVADTKLELRFDRS